MKTKTLDPNNLGPKEDWYGNNAAFECPACGKVYLASSFHKSERPCPTCGKSRARVTGPAGKGQAVVTWDFAPQFVLGRKYTRREVSEILGGSEWDYLPMANKRVVCGCFTLDHNPQAPNVVIPGTGKNIEREAKQFCDQDYPVPVFIKRAVNEWEYVGDYKVVRFSTETADIAAHHCGSITPLNEVTRVIFLQRSAINLDAI